MVDYTMSFVVVLLIKKPYMLVGGSFMYTMVMTRTALTYAMYLADKLIFNLERRRWEVVKAHVIIH